MILPGLRALCTISDYLTLIWEQLVQYLTDSFPLSDQPFSRIPEGIGPLLIRKFSSIDCAIHPRHPDDLMHDLYNFLIIQPIGIFPLTPVPTGPSSEPTCKNYL